MPLPDDIVLLDGLNALDEAQYGQRAAYLSQISNKSDVVPFGVVLSGALINRIARSEPDLAGRTADRILAHFGPDDRLCLRASPQDPAWGGPASFANVRAFDPKNTQLLDENLAFVADFANILEGADDTEIQALRQSPPTDPCNTIAKAFALFEQETGYGFPVELREQIARVISQFARAWTRPSARILREAMAAPESACMGIIIQRMIDIAPNGGKGNIRTVEPDTGEAGFRGNFRALDGEGLQDISALPTPTYQALQSLMSLGQHVLKDAVEARYVFDGQQIHLLGIAHARRASRAELQTLVDLVNQSVITRDQALLRIDPRNLIEHLHPQIGQSQSRDELGRGIPASPGAAVGPIVFTAEDAQSYAAQGENAVLVRAETSPEDIRGMNSASGVLTLTGGITSHAAVIAQGLGVPCVVGANSLQIDLETRELRNAQGRVAAQGELITIDGSAGHIYLGALPLTHSELSPAFNTLMEWSDEVREMGVRANADTPHDARTAARFGVDGIGLCRTEHLFYEGDRIDLMREMILADDKDARCKVLDQLLPMQRGDFIELFKIMAGKPVTIRLLDPPLHEFLPKPEEDVTSIASSMNLPEKEIRRRIEAMQEFNPMLGMRGVRLGVTMPEIYEMQARAIFEAALHVEKASGHQVRPEIMIPLVSAHREVVLVRERLDDVAENIRQETGHLPQFQVGVMVETPRAALRAGDLASASHFLSFGTNDLTQMTYGLSRDDAGRFMRAYVNENVFTEDPFLTLDVEAVGELLVTAAQRGRAATPKIVLGLCGEHGGDPASVRFCKVAGFDYVSCSPYRVPIARVAAAQATLLSRDSK